MKISDTKEIKAANATIFRNFMKANDVTQDKLDAKIGQYVGKKYPERTTSAEHNRVVARHNLRKELGRDNMPTKVLVKGLTILGCGKLSIDGMLEMRK